MNTGKSISRLIAELWGLELASLLVAVTLLWWFDPVSAYSILLGGLIFWGPNAYFALYAFRFRGARAAAQILRSMYRGEVGKLVLTLLGFALVFTLVKPLDVLALFLTYIAMLVGHSYLISRW